jgi:hypothetical protein
MNSNFEVEEQICPLFENKAVLDTLMKLLSSIRVKKAMNSLRETQPLIMNIGESQVTNRDKRLIDTIMYLFEVEVSANLIFDILIMLLSAKGYFFHIEPDIKHLYIRHAVSIEDLESKAVTLGMKQNFLIKHKIHCVKKYVKLNLRNKIAHMEFEIDEKGNFFKYEYKENEIEKKQVDIWLRLKEIIHFTTTVIHQMNLAVKKTR